MRTKPVLIALALALGFGRTAPATAQEEPVRLRRMVVVGDSLLAGFANGGLTARGLGGQRHSAAALVGRRAKAPLTQPLMTSPGLPPPFRIVDENRNGVLDAGEVLLRADGVGFRRDPDRRVRNLAVPGEDVQSVFETIDAADVAEQLITGRPEGRDIMKFLILGLPLDGDVSQLTRARELAPSFVLVWLGSNDVLDMATSADPTALDLTPAQFGVHYRRFLGALADLGADMAVANLVDVTDIAALRRAAGEVTQCRRADGTLAPVAEDDLLPVDLDLGQLPAPPCTNVLDAAERAQVRASVVAFNAEIAAAIAEVEAARGVRIAPVDVFTRFDTVARDGLDVRGNGSLVLTTDYLGGLFSLDGVHPSRTGHALVANAFIDAIDARFGAAIPPVDLARVAARDPLVGNRFRPAGEPPFGLFGDADASVENAFDRIERHADDLAERLADEIDDLF